MVRNHSRYKSDFLILHLLETIQYGFGSNILSISIKYSFEAKSLKQTSMAFNHSIKIILNDLSLNQ